MDKFDVICRTCNTERSNLVNLNSNSPGSETLLLRDVLRMVCPSLPTTQFDERLPQKICYFCSKQLEIAYKFQLQCTKSHEEQWNLIESSLKKEPSPMETYVKNEDSQSIQSDKSNEEEELEDSPAILTENLEFLDEEEIDESDDHVSAVEETQEEPIRVELQTYTESDASNVCCHCSKKFHTPKGLLLHEKLAHKNLKPILLQAEILTIECKYCMQVFETQTELMLHCQRKHSKELGNEFTCTFCQKTFKEKARFRHHLLFHGNKKFLCTVKDCNRSFLVKYKLTDHLRRFHGISLNSWDMKELAPRIIEEP